MQRYCSGARGVANTAKPRQEVTLKTYAGSGAVVKSRFMHAGDGSKGRDGFWAGEHATRAKPARRKLRRPGARRADWSRG